jgi:anti-sigma B factor antagonist
VELSGRTEKQVSILDLSGRFDSYEAPRVTTWLNDAPSLVVVNMGQVNFIDSSALAVLVKGLKRSRQEGGDLILYGLQQPVRVIFELTRLDKAFQIFANQDEAVQAIHDKSGR